MAIRECEANIRRSNVDPERLEPTMKNGATLGSENDEPSPAL
jgi:hypothetical protein